MKSHFILAACLVSAFVVLPTARADPGFCNDPDVLCRYYECHDTERGWECNAFHCDVYLNGVCYKLAETALDVGGSAPASTVSVDLVGRTDCSGAIDAACTYYWCYTSSHGGGMCDSATCIVWLKGRCELD